MHSLWTRNSGPEAATDRERMVERQIRRRGIVDERVLAAMRTVPRERFVPPEHAAAACGDHALPIGHGATISQPYIVARMTAALETAPGQRVLEIGAGSGYQAAVLAACGCHVYGVERIPELFRRAGETLAATGFKGRIQLRLGDGSLGWPEEAPFDRILLSAATRVVPQALFDQLVGDGVLVAPVGKAERQVIRRYRHLGGELVDEALEGARFVPLVGGDAPP